MDGAGLLYADKDPMRVAALMDAVVSDEALQDTIVDGQIAALRRLQSTNFEQTLLGFVDQALASPRMTPPPVTKNFWKQFDADEELEELKITRPSAYRALAAAQ